MQGWARAYSRVQPLRSSLAYACALLCAAIATALQVAIGPYVVVIPFVTFFPAVVIAAMIGGLDAGLLCVVASAIASVIFEEPPPQGVVLFMVLASSLVFLIAARNRAERRTLANNDRLQFVLDAARLGWWEHDVPTRTVRWDRRAMELLNLPAAITGFSDFADRVHPNDRDRVLTAISAAEIDPASSQPSSLEYRINPEAGKMRWLEAYWLARFERGSASAVRMVGTIRDITERKEGEIERVKQQEKEHLLIREVNHRAKNMLSVVDVIAHQTATRNPEDFLESFSERIQALAANQDLLNRSAWQGAEVDPLVRAQLSHFSDVIGSSIVINGPQLELNPASVQAIGLALHELGTNAGKYGALSTDAGRVEVSWTVDDDVFEMTWTESGGPEVSAPTSRGFGTVMMQKMLERTVGGEVSLDYAPSGLTWRLKCPVKNVRDEAAHSPEGRADPT